MAKQSHKHHPRPQQKPKDFLDWLAYFFTFATPLFELPQAYEICANQSAQNVSLFTWSFFCVDNIVWMAYAWRRKLWLVFITSALFEVIELAILFGIIIYR